MAGFMKNAMSYLGMSDVVDDEDDYIEEDEEQKPASKSAFDSDHTVTPLAYITVLFVRMILDWVSVLARNWYPRGVVAQLINIVYSITEPPLRWLRRYIRPLPLGSIYLDVSFIVLYFALVVLESVVLIVF